GLFSGGSGVGGTMKSLGWILMIGIPATIFIVGVLWWFYKKKRWNLDVEIKLPRSDGKFIDAEWGKGFYNFKRGNVFIKRRKKKKIPMKPFDVNKYLQGSRILTVVQVGAEEYRPVLNESWMDMQNDKPLLDKEGKPKLDEDGKPIYEEAALLGL
ncbi:unnamed protein product, partial [marine sediment metagenome]